ncbi:MAG: histidinol dehydrogenase [Vicinamibacterales bacterium]
MLRVLPASSADALALVDRRVTRDPGLRRKVRTIVDAVRREGDAALSRYARRFDHLDGDIEVSAPEMRRLANTARLEVRRAVAACARNIRRAARAQLPRPTRIVVAPGVTIDQTVTPLARVGCYVPGGRFPLPSSLLMTAVTARTAGVRDIVVMCPRVDAVVAAAAIEAGVTRLFRVGGAHAVAALAYGTARVPRADKIVGPGNRYVAAAKAMVASDCPIDFEAGPTELVWVTDRARPEWVARDILAQAEHDTDARAFLVTTSLAEAEAVRDEVVRLAPASGVAATALALNGAALVAGSRREVLEIVNRLAPEHLATDDAWLVAQRPAAGTVFVGAYAAPAAGDYATGSNHVLPTAGAARFRGGLTAADFVRVVAVQRVTRAGLRGIAETAMVMSRVEGLTAHAASIEARVT